MHCYHSLHGKATWIWFGVAIAGNHMQMGCAIVNVAAQLQRARNGATGTPLVGCARKHVATIVWKTTGVVAIAKKKVIQMCVELIKKMKSVLFHDPPILHVSFATPLLQRSGGLAQRHAHRVSGVLRCIQRLRPGWVGCILSRDCIDYIGQVAARDYEYDMKDAVHIRFNVEISCSDQYDLTGFKWSEFDSIRKVRLYGDAHDMHPQHYMQYSIAFYWWPVRGNEREKTFRQMAQFVTDLIPTELFNKHAYGVDQVGGPWHVDIIASDGDACDLKDFLDVAKICDEHTNNISMWFGSSVNF